MRITNTNCESQRHLTSKKVFIKHEREKKRQYNNRIMNVEHGTFTPLVFSVNGGMAKECLKFHKFVAEKIANKSGCRYEKVLSIIKAVAPSQHTQGITQSMISKLHLITR